MNLFLQLSKPNVDIPEDSEVLGKFENWLHRILQMSWDDLLHEAVKLGGKLVAAVLIYIVGRWLIRKADGLLNRIFEKRGLDPSLNSFIRSILRIVVWVFLVMIIVGVLGIRTTSFLAILASAGFAVGMALSGTLQNFAGGVLILLLKPFRTGDYIVSQGVRGYREGHQSLQYGADNSGQQDHHHSQRRHVFQHREQRDRIRYAPHRMDVRHFVRRQLRRSAQGVGRLDRGRFQNTAFARVSHCTEQSGRQFRTDSREGMDGHFRVLERLLRHE